MLLSLEITTILAFTRKMSFLAVVLEALAKVAQFVASHTRVSVTYSRDAGVKIRMTWEMLRYVKHFIFLEEY